MKIIWHAFLVLAILLFISVLTTEAKPIQMPIYWVDYQDYLDNPYRYTNVNLSEHPYYLYDFGGSNATFTSSGTTISIPKANTTFELGLDRVSQKLTYSKSFLQSKMINYNATVAYINVPYSVLDNLDYEDSKKIKKGRWLFNAGNEHISIYDDNITRNYLNYSAYDFKIVNKEIRLYFLKAEANKLQGNITFQTRTWMIDNATTSGFTSPNVTTNGYYSAYGGGSIGTPLNDSIHTNLSLYADCEATQGNIQYGINRYGRFPNTSIQGTWSGNLTQNTTAGQNWGTACSFDGLNDYYDFGNNESLNISNVSMKLLSKIFSIGAGQEAGLLQKTDFKYGLTFYQVDSRIYFYTQDGAHYSNIIGSVGLDYNINGVYNGTTRRLYINDVLEKENTALGLDISGSTNLYSGRIAGDYLNGTTDEMIIDSSGNPIYSNSTYATSHYVNFTNQTASAGKIITGVRFSVPYLNTLNNTANVSVGQNGTGSFTLIAENYQNWTWANFTQTWNNGTDILFEGFGNGSSRMFVVSGEVDEKIGNQVNFTFSNKSLSETQISQSSQPTIISLDVTDPDGNISAVTMGVTFNGYETNFTMAQSGTKWSYSFKSGAPGTYTVSNFYATDNGSGTNSSSWGQQFVVVPVVGGGSGGTGEILLGAFQEVSKQTREVSIYIKTQAKDETRNYLMNELLGVFALMIVVGSKKNARNGLFLWGIIGMFFIAYFLGYLE